MVSKKDLMDRLKKFKVTRKKVFIIFIIIGSIVAIILMVNHIHPAYGICGLEDTCVRENIRGEWKFDSEGKRFISGCIEDSSGNAICRCKPQYGGVKCEIEVCTDEERKKCNSNIDVPVDEIGDEEFGRCSAKMIPGSDPIPQCECLPDYATDMFSSLSRGDLGIKCNTTRAKVNPVLSDEFYLGSDKNNQVYTGLVYEDSTCDSINCNVPDNTENIYSNEGEIISTSPSSSIKSRRYSRRPLTAAVIAGRLLGEYGKRYGTGHLFINNRYKSGLIKNIETKLLELNCGAEAGENIILPPFIPRDFWSQGWVGAQVSGEPYLSVFEVEGIAQSEMSETTTATTGTGTATTTTTALYWDLTSLDDLDAATPDQKVLINERLINLGITQLPANISSSSYEWIEWKEQYIFIMKLLHPFLIKIGTSSIGGSVAGYDGFLWSAEEACTALTEITEETYRSAAEDYGNIKSMDGANVPEGICKFDMTKVTTDSDLIYASMMEKLMSQIDYYYILRPNLDTDDPDQPQHGQTRVTQGAAGQQGVIHPAGAYTLYGPKSVFGIFNDLETQLVEGHTQDMISVMVPTSGLGVDAISSLVTGTATGTDLREVELRSMAIPVSEQLKSELCNSCWEINEADLVYMMQDLEEDDIKDRTYGVTPRRPIRLVLRTLPGSDGVHRSQSQAANPEHYSHWDPLEPDQSSYCSGSRCTQNECCKDIQGKRDYCHPSEEKPAGYVPPYCG